MCLLTASRGWLVTTSRNKVALVDGDIICYRSAASCMPTKGEPDRREEDYVAKGRAADILNRIGDRTQATEYRVFISGTDNFRYRLFPDYKANRLGVTRPEHLGAVQQFLVKRWGATIVNGYEADDAIGIAATEDSVICSIDKDLRQISGEHYNFVKDTFEVVSPEDATYQLYSQMLIGDSSDNIRGVEGIGPVKARKHLENLSAEEMHLRVRELYGDDERFILNLRLLSVLRSEEQYLQVLGEIDADKQCESEGEKSTEDSGSSGTRSLEGVNEE
jgi:5'-3' exonuclease